MAPSKPQTMTLRVLDRIKLGDNREIRILKIPTGTNEDLVRIGVNGPSGEDLSGAVFPESYIQDVINALRAAKNG